MKKFTLLLALFMLNFLFLQAVQNCLDFDGAAECVNIEHDPSLDMGTGGITIEAWIKTSANTPEDYWPCIVEKTTWGTRQGFALFIAHHTNRIAFEVWSSNNWYGVWGQVINDGKWHHVVGRRTGNRIYVFKDGVQSGGWIQTGSNGDVNVNDPLMIGDASWGTGGNFTGKIDEVRVWNRALSNDEILELMFKELDGSEVNLQAYYQFDETSGTTLPDHTVYNNDGLLLSMGTEDWMASYAPIATVLTENLTDVRGVWSAKNSHVSSILTISDPDISGNNRIVFGHNNGDLVFDSANVPTGIENRLSRAWRIEEYGILSGDVIFDCSGFGTRNENYRLLVDDDSDFSNATIIEGTFISPQFTVSDHDFEHSYYYTLAIAQDILPFPENILIHTENDSVFISWNEVDEATSYKVYSDTDPYGTFSTEEWTGTEMSWNEPVSEDKKFYYVTAVN